MTLCRFASFPSPEALAVCGMFERSPNGGLLMLVACAEAAAAPPAALWSGPLLVGGLYAEAFIPPLPTGLCMPAPGAPMRLCMSVLGFTKSLELFAGGGNPSLGGGAGTTVDPAKPRFTGTDRLWSTPAVLRIDGLSACGSNLGKVVGAGSGALLSPLTCAAARAE